MPLPRLPRPAVVAVLALAALATGCADSGQGPNQPPPPDLSTPQAFVVALQEAWGYRRLEEAMGLLSEDYRFFPTRPESIAFLDSGAMSWDRAAEQSILELLLVEERTTWIDQVLLEVTRVDQRDLGGGMVEYDAEVQLKLLIGADSFRSAESRITYLLQQDTEGDYHLVEEHETMEPGRLPIGELRAQVLDDR
ncbi:hypothetical protein K8I85_00240 [bacterium]|nr:hypothetical protein [bacterium]